MFQKGMGAENSGMGCQRDHGRGSWLLVMGESVDER